MSDLKKMSLLTKDVDINKIVSSMNNAAEAMKTYAKMDVKATTLAFRRIRKKLFPKPKHNSAFRTVSNRKWVGHKNNKPKHNWSKKRKARGGWKV